MRLLIGALALLLIAVGCSSSSRVVPVSRSLAANTHVRQAGIKIAGAMPSPYNPARDRLEAAVVKGRAVDPSYPHFEPPSFSRKGVSNVTGHDGGGQAGFGWSSSATDGQVYVAQTAYLSDYFGGSFSLPTPAPGMAWNILNAPTTHAGGTAGCLESVTSYSNGFGWIGSTRGQLQVYDFCLPGWGEQWDIDSTFIDNYVRYWSGGLSYDPEYIVEQRLMTDGKVHMLVYNANTSSWDDFYTASTGTNTRTDGWSIFETHFGQSSDPVSATENCPASLPETGESGLRLHNGSGWYLVDGSTLSGTPGSWGDCFVGNPNTSPYFVFAYDFSSDAQWTVNSY